MHKARVYIECSDRCLRKTKKMTGFIKVLPDGQKWKFIGRPQPITYNRGTLWAFVMAVRSLDDIYELHVYSKNGYVMQQLTNGNLERWVERDFVAKDGKPITDADLWKELARGLKCQKVVPHIEEHEYTEVFSQLFEEAEKMKD